MSDEIKKLLERVETVEKQIDLIVDFLELLGEAERNFRQIETQNMLKEIEEQSVLEDFLKRTQNPDKPIGDT